MKQEIWESLRNYSIFFEYLITHPKEKIGNVIGKIYHNDEKKIEKEKNILIIYMCLRYFSNIDEEYFKSIQNKDIAKEELKRSYFKTPGESKKFSWKNILKYMRKTFLEENGEDITYRMIENGKKVEMHYEKASPIPFHFTIDRESLVVLVDFLLLTEYYYHYSYVDFNKKEFSLVYLIDTWNITLEKKYIDLRAENKTYQEQYHDYLKLLDDSKTRYQIKKFKLLDEQFEAYQSIDNRKTEDYLGKFFQKMMMNYYSPSIMPIQGIKTFFDVEQINLLLAFNQNMDKNFDEFMAMYQEIFKTFILNLQKDDFSKKQYNFYLEDPFRIMTNMKPMIYQKYFDTILEMAYYYYKNMDQKKNIVVGNITIKKDVFLKDLKEGYWFINPNQKPILTLVEERIGKTITSYKKKQEMDLELLKDKILEDSKE